MKTLVLKKNCLLMASLGFWVSSASFGDEYHYTNQILGNRNIGVGGAVAALVTGPTALVYNPSGLAFGTGKNVSGSMTSYAIQNYDYEDVLGSQDFEVKSDGVVASYIGFESRFSMYPEWVFAFGIFVPDSFQQSQKIKVADAPELGITGGYWARKQDAEESLYMFGAGRNVGSNFAMGWSMGYLQQKSDDMLRSEFNYLPNSALPGAYLNISSDYKAKTDVQGVLYNIGCSYIHGRHRWGGRLQAASVVSQKRRGEGRQTLLYTDQQGQPLGAPPRVGVEVLQSSNFVIDDERAYGEPPVLLRVGYAYLGALGTISSDVEYIHSRYDRYLRTRTGYVLNHSLGIETSIGRNIRVRVGTFSNDDARPELNGDQKLQPSEEKVHIDFRGYTSGIGYYTDGGHYSIGVVYQQGSGRAALVSSADTSGGQHSAAIDSVSATSLQLAIGVSSSL